MKYILYVCILQTFESYLLEANAQNILEEKSNPLFPRLKMRILLKHVSGFIIRHFGPTPSREQKKAVAAAVVNLIPSLKCGDSDSDGIVGQFFNSIFR